jgi:hypothetical protein
MNITAIANAIIEHSIIPYAKSAEIDIGTLIDEIATINYLDRNKVKVKVKVKAEAEAEAELKYNDTKRGRGRPKGAKNKNKNDILMRNIQND